MWVYQSNTASVKVPELGLELASGTLGGLVTTIEGLITKINESEYNISQYTSIFMVILSIYQCISIWFLIPSTINYFQNINMLWGINK